MAQREKKKLTQGEEACEKMEMIFPITNFLSCVNSMGINCFWSKNLEAVYNITLIMEGFFD